MIFTTIDQAVKMSVVIVIRNRIYINQQMTFLFDTDTDLTDALTIKIRHKDPSGNVGYIDATETTPGSQIITGFMPGNDNDEVGRWEFRSWITFSNDPNPVPGVEIFVDVKAV